jgi:hypothetical protein
VVKVEDSRTRGCGLKPPAVETLLFIALVLVGLFSKVSIQFNTFLSLASLKAVIETEQI